MNSIMIKSKTNMVTKQDYYYLQILTACCMKLKLKIFIMILVRIKKYLMLVIILANQNIIMTRTN